MPQAFKVTTPEGQAFRVTLPDAPTPDTAEPTFVRRAATFAARVAPPVIGGLLAGPPGAIAGGIAGETLAQSLEIGYGREELNPLSIGVAGAAGVVPIAKLKAATPFVKRVAARALQGAGEAGAASLATEAAEGRGFQPVTAAKSALAGAVLGGVGGGIEARAFRESGTAPAAAASVAGGLKTAIRSGSRDIAQLKQSISRLERDMQDGVAAPGTENFIALQKDRLRTLETGLTDNRNRLRAAVPIQTPGEEVGPGTSIQRASQKAFFGTEETARPSDLAPIEVKAASYTHDQIVTADDFVRRNPDVSDDFLTNFPAGNARRHSAERVDAVFGDLPETNRTILKEVVARNASLIDESARGRISDAVRNTMARRLQPRLGKKLAQGEILTTEATRASVDYAARLADDIAKLSDTRAEAILRGDDAADLTTTIMQKHNDLGLLVSGVYGSASEAGRTLRTMRGPRTVEGEAARGARKLLREAKARGVKPTVSADDITAIMLAVKQGRSPAEKAAAEAAFTDILLDLTDPSMGQRLASVLKGSMLLRVGTNLRNIASSAYNIAHEAATLPFKVGADVAGAARTGREREVFLDEYKGLLQGVWLGAQEGAQMASKGLRHRDFESSAGLIEAVRKGGLAAAERTELSPGQAALTFRGSPALTKATAPLRLSGQLLERTDTFFQSIGRHITLQRMAVASAKKAGLRGEAARAHISELTANPTEAMLGASEALQKRITFQEDSGAVSKWIMKGMADWRRASPTSLVGDLVLPFVKTPSNILRRQLLHTPGLGFAMAPKEVNRLLTKASGGHPKLRAQLAPRFTAELTGEAMYGVGMLAPIALLVASGRLSGAASPDPVQRDLDYRAGKIPNAVRIGDTWVKLATVAPQLALPASIVANTFQMYQQAKHEGYNPDVGLLAAGVIMQAGWSATDASYFEGINRLATAMQRAATSADLQQGADTLMGQVSQAAGSFVPGIVGEVASAMDPIVRDPKGPVGAVLRNIPGATSMVQARLTGRGEPARKTPLIPGLGDFSVAQTPDRLDTILTTLREQGFEVGVAPPRDMRKVGVPDVANFQVAQEALEPNAARAANAAVAQFATRLMMQVVEKPGFADLPPSVQAKALNTVKSKAQTVVGKMTQAAVMNGQPVTPALFSRLGE